MDSTRRLVAALFVALFVSNSWTGCSSAGTSLEGVWIAPGLKELNFKKVLVIAATPNVELRHFVEDGLQTMITGSVTEPSYKLLPQWADLRDRPNLIKVVKGSDCDGVVVLSLLLDRDEQRYSLGSSTSAEYTSFDSYCGSTQFSAIIYAPPVDIQMNRIVGVETRIFRVADGKLVWSGVTITKNPPDRAAVVEQVVWTVQADLKAQHLIK